MEEQVAAEEQDVDEVKADADHRKASSEALIRNQPSAALWLEAARDEAVATMDLAMPKDQFAFCAGSQDTLLEIVQTEEQMDRSRRGKEPWARTRELGMYKLSCSPQRHRI